MQGLLSECGTGLTPGPAGHLGVAGGRNNSPVRECTRPAALPRAATPRLLASRFSCVTDPSDPRPRPRAPRHCRASPRPGVSRAPARGDASAVLAGRAVGRLPIPAGDALDQQSVPYLCIVAIILGRQLRGGTGIRQENAPFHGARPTWVEVGEPGGDRGSCSTVPSRRPPGPRPPGGDDGTIMPLRLSHEVLFTRAYWPCCAGLGHGEGDVRTRAGRASSGDAGAQMPPPDLRVRDQAAGRHPDS